MTDDILKLVRQMIRHHEEDPNSVANIRHTLAETSRDIILLEEILVYLRESIDQDESIYAIPDSPAGQRLYEILGLKVMLNDLKVRVEDMRKILEAAREEINGLRIMVDTITDAQTLRVHEDIRGSSGDVDTDEVEWQAGHELVRNAIHLQVCSPSSCWIESPVNGAGPHYQDCGKTHTANPFMNKPLVWFTLACVFGSAWRSQCIISFDKSTTNRQGRFLTASR